MDSVELATKASEALNNIKLDKSHTSIAVTYNEFEKIEKLPKTYEEKKQLQFENANEWEKSNFTEMLLIESKEKITVGTIHFLRKTFTVNYTLPNSRKINEIKWSPQGKYLVITREDRITLYGGENDQPITEIKVHSHNCNISNDENYIVTFSGYQNKGLNDPKKEDKKEEDKKEENKK